MILHGKSTTQSYLTLIYYKDQILHFEINLQKAISSSKQIEEQSKSVGFYQEALDHVSRQGESNGGFKTGLILLRSSIWMRQDQSKIAVPPT